ncbi:MAG: lmo0937 family membrane protein [Bacteroidota bacterium]|nr:lmo0937 family membrane protein [Bacteroidota bacterium]
MKNINYIVALILIIFWVIGFFTHFMGYPIHFLLIGALLLIFVNVLHDDRNNPTEKI